MPRPCKRRRICVLPSCARFGPMEEGESSEPAVWMTVDEFESIHQIDLEGLTQEQCAQRMNIARTTAQAIYNCARTKLAQCLVYGRELRIEGGDYVLCDGNAQDCHCRRGRRCCRNAEKLKGERNIMKIAVTYENGNIFQHFGHTEQFKVYEIENKQVTAQRIVGTDGSGHGALAGMLRSLEIDTLICGGIGGGARMALEEAGITLYGGASGDADAAVEALLTGKLQYNPDVTCHHHDHEHNGEPHRCGDHGCGEHTSH